MEDDGQDVLVQIERPTESVLVGRWRGFHADPLLSMAQLKQHAMAGAIDQRGLRSLHWRVSNYQRVCVLPHMNPQADPVSPCVPQYFFGLLPSPSPPSASTWSAYEIALQHSRSDYEQLRTRFLTSPDGTWVNDGASSTSHSPKLSGHTNMKTAEVQVNNPLGLDSANPWSSWFQDLELRRTIRQDVQRT